MSRGEEAALPAAVLFACDRNAIRSPMAAAIVRRFVGHEVYVASAGVRGGEPDPFVREVMAEIGIDLSAHLPQTFEELADTSFDLVISLSPQAHHRAVEMTRTMAITVEYWPIPDPTDRIGSRAQVLDAYRAVRDLLIERVRRRFVRPPPPNP